MQAALTSLMLDIRSGEDCIVIGDLVRVELVHKSGSAARIRVMAPREVVIKKESIDAKHAMQKQTI